ncbi:unnamed protein product, partial [Mesorhabditis spiculigera]
MAPPSPGTKRVLRNKSSVNQTEKNDAAESKGKSQKAVKHRQRMSAETGGDDETQHHGPSQRASGRSGKRTAGSCEQQKRAPPPKLAPEVVAALDKFVQHMEKLGPTGMLEEFDANKAYLPSDVKCEVANKYPEKNRFKDVLCLDSTRVVLRNDYGNYTSADGDYIHANWVMADDLERKYIATQGPLPGTIEDFWRMTFQENATSIICLGLAAEANGSGFNEYWPAKVADFKNYGKMFVNNKKVETDPKSKGLTIYTLEVLPDGCSNSNVIKLIHCPGWADQSAASSGHSAISILRLMKESGSGTTVVHCSAGIGRTGTLIAIDMIATRLLKGKEVMTLDVFKEVRNCRAGAVQTAPQYLFIYSTVLDYIKAKSGDKHAAFRQKFYKLLQKLA